MNVSLVKTPGRTLDKSMTYYRGHSTGQTLWAMLMTIRWERLWKRLLKLFTPLFIGAIAFHIYVQQLPTVQCTIVNEAEQTVVKEKGDRCYQLTEEEEAFVFTVDGVSLPSDTREFTFSP